VEQFGSTIQAGESCKVECRLLDPYRPAGPQIRFERLLAHRRTADLELHLAWEPDVAETHETQVNLEFQPWR
jgi:hypothetical protein